MLAVSPALATYVDTIINPSFEIPTLSERQTSSTVTGWTHTTGGVWYPYGYTDPGGGHQVAFVGNGTFYQEIATTIQAGATYTLEALVRKYYNNNYQQYRLQLYAVDEGQDVLLSETVGIPAVTGNWYAISTAYLANNSAYYGDPLKIELVGQRLSGTQGELDWDIIKLDYAAAVPIPATLLLLGTGLVGLVGFRRLKKQ